MNDVFFSLRELGLTATESTVYVALLRLGSARAGKIAEHAKTYRKNTYDALAALKDLGLVSSAIQDGVSHWQATHPNRIRELLDERIARVEQLLPELIGSFEQHKHKQQVEVLLGLGGMKTFFRHILLHATSLDMLGATGAIYDKLEFFSANFVAGVNEKHIPLRILLSSKAKYKQRHIHDFPTAEVAVLPKDLRSATQLFLYDPFAAVVIWSEQPICVLIESRQVTKGFLDHFVFLWKRSDLLIC